MSRTIQSIRNATAREVARQLEQYKRNRQKPGRRENTPARQLYRESHYVRALANSLSNYANMLSREAQFTLAEEREENQRNET